MTKMCCFQSLFLVSLLAACGGDGGGSGLPEDSQVSALSAEEAATLCAWVIDQYPDSFTCEGQTIEIDEATRSEFEADCNSDLTQAKEACDLTVADVETCIEDALADPCAEPQSPACEKVAACVPV